MQQELEWPPPPQAYSLKLIKKQARSALETLARHIYRLGHHLAGSGFLRSRRALFLMEHYHLVIIWFSRGYESDFMGITFNMLPSCHDIDGSLARRMLIFYYLANGFDLILYSMETPFS
jgi:hypothetical protein